MDKIELHAPIKVNGEDVRELTYDPEQITVAQLAAAEASAKAAKAKRQSDSVVAVAEFDYTFHFYLGCAAVIAVNPAIDVTDLERIKGRDIMRLVGVGRFFTLPSGEQGEGTSDGPSATTRGHSQRQSERSTGCASSTSSSTTERP